MIERIETWKKNAIPPQVSPSTTVYSIGGRAVGETAKVSVRVAVGVADSVGVSVMVEVGVSGTGGLTMVVAA
jgi:hypothetical protein